MGGVQAVLDLVVFERFPCDQLIAWVVLDEQYLDRSAF
jgi:hypothetical protein